MAARSRVNAPQGLTFFYPDTPGTKYTVQFVECWGPGDVMVTSIDECGSPFVDRAHRLLGYLASGEAVWLEEQPLIGCGCGPWVHCHPRARRRGDR